MGLAQPLRSAQIYLDRSSSGGFVSRARAKIRRGETLELGVVRLLPVEGRRGGDGRGDRVRE